MEKIAHLIGNGPSKSSFRDEPVGDLFGCNLSSNDLKLKATFILDADVFEHIQKSRLVLPWPVVCPERWERRAASVGFKVFDILQNHLRLGENTGHIAAKYLQDHGYREIHLWGMDSLKTATAASDTQSKIPKAIWSDSNVPRWHDNWLEIFAMKKAAFTIH